MFPTLSHLLKYLFGVNIPLPIQTYGLMVATALLLGTWVFWLEYKRKEKEGLLLPVYIDKKVGYPASAGELITTFIVSFLIWYKVVAGIFHYN